jgi:4-alpha-glucanotransferase
VFIPLHALRSERSWGAGDFTDLDRLVEWVARLGGRSVATLPLLAAFLEGTGQASPYSPASRLFWNELFLDVTAVPEIEISDQARSLLQSTWLRREIAALQKRDLVDHRGIAVAKRRILAALARSFFTAPSPRRDAFDAWLKMHPSVQDYARFRGACERRGPWPEWPARERDGNLPARVTPTEEEARRYHAYVQWLSDEQLSAVSARARRKGIALYFDLPLGVHPAGYDVWREREAFAVGVSAGAPPDAFFSGGQDWGFPPLHPERIRDHGYQYPIACLRQLLRHAGVLRLDHVMSLHRLFWVPHGMSARDGVYVRYRPDEQYAILTLESSRAGAIVVGEDLGTVPARVRYSLRRHGMLRSHVLQFEVDPDPRTAIRRPQPDAVASIGTHDTPTFASFWRGLDIEERAARRWITADEARREQLEREALRTALVEFLKGEGWLGRTQVARPVAPQTETAVLRGCLAHLAAGPAAMVIVALEDLWLETMPQNVPGTTDQYPNWRRAARYRFESFRGRPQVAGTLKEIDRLRRRAPA